MSTKSVFYILFQNLKNYLLFLKVGRRQRDISKEGNVASLDNTSLDNKSAVTLNALDTGKTGCAYFGPYQLNNN